MQAHEVPAQMRNAFADSFFFNYFCFAVVVVFFLFLALTTVTLAYNSIII